jgi:N-methylhydantoinase B
MNPLDPTTFAVISRAFNSIAEEMSLTFEYSAWSSIISEAKDYSCAIYDAGSPPNAVCNVPAIPVHVNAQPVATGHIAEFFGDDIADGDILMVNSAYYGCTHTGDLVVAAPVFHDGVHRFWTVATGHQMDVGSSFNTSVPVQATDIWKEGLQIPPLRLEEGGRLRKDVLNLYLENLRYRDFVYGDLMSQVGSVKTAKRRVLELIERWGIETLRTFATQIIDYADRRTADEVMRWPDGVYRSRSWVDSDGHGIEHIKIECQLTIAGDHITIDYTGSDPQARGGVNASWATCQNASTTPILMCVDPDIPHNQGCLSHIHVVAPKGTITNVEWPGCTADAPIVPADAISDAVWKCLAQAIPEKAVAGFGHIAPNAVSSGADRRTPGEVKPWSAIFFNGSSGGGACAEYDGWPLMYNTSTAGSLSFVPNEVMELHYPVLVRRHEVRTDSMGAGRTRGGPGLTFHVESRGGQVDNYGYGDGMANPPHGLFGGRPGDGGALYRINADGAQTFFSMICYFRVRDGESWVALSTGGGGYGDPLERDPARVQTDVRHGFVSLGAARREYGVVLHAQTLEIDHAATAALRTRLAAERGDPAPIVPTEPATGTYFRALMGPDDTYELNPQPSQDADFTL